MSEEPTIPYVPKGDHEEEHHHNHGHSSNYAYGKFARAIVSEEPHNAIQELSDGIFIDGIKFFDSTLPFKEGEVAVDVNDSSKIRIVSQNNRAIVFVGDDIDTVVLQQYPVSSKIEELYIIRETGNLIPISVGWEFGVSVNSVEGPHTHQYDVGSFVHLIRKDHQNWISMIGLGAAESVYALARAWAEGSTPPGGPETKSAKTWAEEAIQSATNASEDRIQTGLDRIATGEDAQATAADRVQTGLDRGAVEQAVIDAQAAKGFAEAARSEAIGAKNSVEIASTNFNKRYLGSFSSPPATDALGNPIESGAIYFDTVLETLRSFTGSAWVSVSTDGTFFTDIPEVPNGLSISSQIDELPGGSFQAIVYVSWLDAARASSYDLDVTPAGGASTRHNVTGVNFNFVSAPGKNWSIRVRGRSAASRVSAWSGTKTHTAIKDNIPPSVPTGFKANPGVGVIWLTWNENPEDDMSHYEIYESESPTPAPDAGTPATHSTAASSIPIHDLGASTQRWFWIRAVDTSSNRSDWSSSANATTAVGAAVDPASLIDLIDSSMIKEHAITANRLAVTDFTNLIENPDFTEETESWSIPEGANRVTAPINMLTDWAIVIPYSSSDKYIHQDISNILEGETYLLSCKVRAGDGPNDQFTPSLGIYWYDSDDVQVGDSLFEDIGDPLTTNHTDIFYIQAKAPTGATKARVYFGRRLEDGDFTATEAGNAYMSHFGVRLMNAGELIVDGSISANHLTTEEVVITGSAQIDGAVINNAHIAELTSEKLTVNSLLKVDQGGALGVYKDSLEDPADGAFFGREADGRFGMYISRTEGGRQQEVSFTDAGLRLLNASHYVFRETAPPWPTTLDTSLAKTALPEGTTSVRIVAAWGGGGGGSSSTVGLDGSTDNHAGDYYSPTQRFNPGAAGGDTIIKLYDGAILKHTITAPGAEAQTNFGVKNRNDVSGASSEIGTGGHGAGAGGRAAGGGAIGANSYKNSGFSSRRYRNLGGRGGKAAPQITVPWIDVSEWNDPQIEVIIGAGGAGGAPHPDGGYSRRGGDGGPGRAIYQYATSSLITANVVPLQPQVAGAFTAFGTTGSFPDHGPGMWMCWRLNEGSSGLGWYIINDEISIPAMDFTTVTFFSHQTPQYYNYTPDEMIGFAFYYMGDESL